MQMGSSSVKELLLKFRPKCDDLFEEEIFSYAPCSEWCEGEETLQRFETEVLQQLADRIGVAEAPRSIFLYEKCYRNEKEVLVGRSARLIYDKLLNVVQGKKSFEQEFPGGDKEMGMIELYVGLPRAAPRVLGELQPSSMTLGPVKCEDNAWQVNVKQDIKTERNQRARSTIRKDIREMVNSLCSKYCPQDQSGMFLLGGERWAMAEEMVINNVQAVFANETWNPDAISGLRKHMVKYMSSVNETIRSGKRSGQSMDKRLDEAAAWRKAYERIYKAGASIPGLDDLRLKLGGTSVNMNVPPLSMETSTLGKAIKKVSHMDKNGSVDPGTSCLKNNNKRKETAKRKRGSCTDQ